MMRNGGTMKMNYCTSIFNTQIFSHHNLITNALFHSLFHVISTLLTSCSYIKKSDWFVQCVL